MLQGRLLGGHVLYEVGYADLSRTRGRGFASHGPLGCFVVTLVIWPAGNGGRWLGIVTSHTVAGFGSSGGDVSVR